MNHQHSTDLPSIRKRLRIFIGISATYSDMESVKRSKRQFTRLVKTWTRVSEVTRISEANALARDATLGIPQLLPPLSFFGLYTTPSAASKRSSRAAPHTHTHTSQCLLPTTTTPSPPPTQAPLHRCPSGVKQGLSRSRAPDSARMGLCLVVGLDTVPLVRTSSTQPKSVASELLSVVPLIVSPEEKPLPGHRLQVVAAAVRTASLAPANRALTLASAKRLLTLATANRTPTLASAIQSTSLVTATTNNNLATANRPTYLTFLTLVCSCSSSNG